MAEAAKVIQQPKDPYSPEWAAYWDQHPGAYRGVGAEGAEKVEVDKAEFESLQEKVKSIDSLQESVTKLEENNKALLKEKADAKDAARKAAEEAAKKGGDVEALEKSWQEKLANETAKRDEKLNVYQQQINSLTVGATAQSMAAELALPGSADVLLPHITKRLSVEITENGPIVRVLDKAGKPSAMSIDDLKKEISTNESFAPLLVASKASGDGGAGKKGGKDGAKTIKRTEFEALSPADQAKHFKEGGKVED